MITKLKAHGIIEEELRFQLDGLDPDQAAEIAECIVDALDVESAFEVDDMESWSLDDD